MISGEEMWYMIKELIIDGFAIAAGILSLFIFYKIVTVGAITLVENSPWILWSEIVMGLFLFGLGIERTVCDFKHAGKRND